MTANNNIVIKNTGVDNIPGIIELCRRVYPKSKPWTYEQLASHQNIFPEGQFVALDAMTGEVLGMAASLIILWDDYDMDYSWKDFTDAGMFSNHDVKRGRTLYGAEVMVDTKMQGRGIGKLLYAARFDLTVKLGLLRIRAGARLRNYHQYANTLSVSQYVKKVVLDLLSDSTLTFQLKQDFHVIGIVENYLRDDPASLGHAAVIEWINQNVAVAEDYMPRDSFLNKLNNEK